MCHSHWQVSSKFGFLTSKNPNLLWQQISSNLHPLNKELSDNGTNIQSLNDIVSYYLQKTKSSQTASHTDDDSHFQSIQEMLFMYFGYVASTWVGLGHTTIPSLITKPLVELAQVLNRPPMLSYAGMVLTNWRLKDPELGFVPNNIDLILRMTDIIDEHWFFKVHIAIEAQAGAMLQAMVDVQSAIADEDDNTVLIHLRTMQRGLVQITKTFHEMPKLCDPDIYFQQIRPYLMSFDDDIVFEGISPNPTPLRGGSGAQSSIVPAMLAGLGIDHQQSQLTANLQDMRRYMPQEHVNFIDQMKASKLREYCKTRPPLSDAYNHVLRQLITFRRAHLYYARTYIFEKSTNPIGTGGTEYMSFLSKLIDETANQML